MSIPVEVEELADAIGRLGSAGYLLTTSTDGRPHATSVAVEVDGSIIRCSVGRRSVRNALAQPLVSLLWPPTESGGYSLIVDGDITVEGNAEDGGMASIQVTHAVLHRPAASEDAGGAACASDCLPVDVP